MGTSKVFADDRRRFVLGLLALSAGVVLTVVVILFWRGDSEPPRFKVDPGSLESKKFPPRPGASKSSPGGKRLPSR